MPSATIHMPPEQNRKDAQIERTMNRFLAWIKETHYEGYDAYDLWATRLGIVSRKLFYMNKFLAAPFVAPIAAADLFFPGIRCFVSSKKRYATADAHLVLGFLNLNAAMGDQRFLSSAESLAADLIASSIKGYSGLCWGYPFDWQNNRGLWKRGTPFITVTPYVFEALLALYDVTHKKTYLDAALSSAAFAFKDLKETWRNGNIAAASYSPFDDSRIINANSYRAMMLTEAYARIGDANYLRAAEENIDFILQSQTTDGSWFYAEGNPKDAFIDHFHTCFVLKNLYKLNRHLKRSDVSEALSRGLRFYHNGLFDSDGQPQPFAAGRQPGILKMTMYDAAEAISLGVLMRSDYTENYSRAVELALKIHKYQHPQGYFATAIYHWGPQYFPYIRWPQAQLFFALSSLLRDMRHKLCAA